MNFKTFSQNVIKHINELQSAKSDLVTGSNLQFEIETNSRGNKNGAIYLKGSLVTASISFDERYVGTYKPRPTGKFKCNVNGFYGRGSSRTKTFMELKNGGFNYDAIAKDILEKLWYKTDSERQRVERRTGYDSATKIVERIEPEDINISVKANNDGTVSVTFRNLTEEEAKDILAKCK